MKYRRILLVSLLAFVLVVLVGCSAGKSDANQTEVEPDAEVTTEIATSEEAGVPEEVEDDAEDDVTGNEERSPEAVEYLNGVKVIAAPEGSPTTTDLLPEDQWGNLFPTMGEEVLTPARRMLTELPVKAYAAYMGMGGTRPVRFDDPGQITALFNALASANVNLEEEEMVWTDDYTSFWFTFADGEEFGVYMDTIAVNPPDDGDPYAYYPVTGGEDFNTFCTIAHDSYENMGKNR